MSNFYHLLNFLADKLNIEYTISFNTVYFKKTILDRWLNEIDTEHYFQFNINEKFECFNFFSELFRCKIKSNNYVDFILDIYNYFLHITIKVKK